MRCPSRSVVEERVLERIRPTEFQLKILKNIYKLVLKILSNCLKEEGLSFEIMPVGSYSKGTLTSYKWELDIFILLKNVDDKWILEKSEYLLTKCISPYLPLTVKYAQHPYITVSLLGVDVDIVPALWVDKPRKKGLGVERTPFHTKYVIQTLHPCLKDDVRLLKSFLKGLNIYGAETGIYGFSGYLAELLIIHYGGFRKLLEAAARWKPPIYLDLEGQGNKEKLIKKYNNPPLIVVDPTDPERNAAASVSLKSLATFILGAKLYLTNPRIEFFYPYATRSKIPHRGPILIIECNGDYQELSPEALRGIAFRAVRNLYNYLSLEGFKPTLYHFDTNEYDTIKVEVGLEASNIPGYSTSYGPYAWDSYNRVLSFTRKRSRNMEAFWINDDGIITGLRRKKHTSVVEAVEAWLRDIGKRILRAESCRIRIIDCPGEAELCYPVPQWMVL